MVEKASSTNRRRDRLLRGIARSASLVVRRLYATTGNRRPACPSIGSTNILLRLETFMADSNEWFPHLLLYQHQPPLPIFRPKCQHAASIGPTSDTPLPVGLIPRAPPLLLVLICTAVGTPIMLLPQRRKHIQLHWRIWCAGYHVGTR